MVDAGHVTSTLPSDWCSYGRVPAIVVSNAVCLVCGVVTPFMPEFVSFLVLRFIMGLAFNTFYTVPYILGRLKLKLQQSKLTAFAVVAQLIYFITYLITSIVYE